MYSQVWNYPLNVNSTTRNYILKALSLPQKPAAVLVPQLGVVAHEPLSTPC